MELDAREVPIDGFAASRMIQSLPGSVRGNLRRGHIWDGAGGAKSEE